MRLVFRLGGNDESWRPTNANEAEKPVLPALKNTLPSAHTPQNGLDLRRLAALLSNPASFNETPDEPAWRRIIELAERHQVAQVLYYNLKMHPAAGIPPEAVQRLRDIYLAAVSLNVKKYHKVDVILQAFAQEGIPVVPFKGAWLASLIYPNDALRLSSDIDLWIQKDRLDDARSLMASLGYTAHSKSERPQALQDALTGETQMFKENWPMVELHWNIFPGEWMRHTGLADEKAVWDRTQPWRGPVVRQLSTEDAIVQLCFHHAVSHQMSMPGLRLLLDLHFIREKLPVDWNKVAACARQWRVAAATWIVLDRFAGLFGDPHREIPLDRLSPSTLRKKVLRRFMRHEAAAENQHISSGPRRFLFLLFVVDRPVDSLHLLWRGIVPDRQWLILRYGLENAPPWRIRLQRLWHPFRVALKRNI
jgi:hypothetical protein